MKKTKLLFICLGNICRSPAAEGVMKHIVAQAGHEEKFEIDSAGIGDWHVGQLPDARMRRHGAARGYTFDSRARQFKPADFERFDYLLVMDHDNYRAISAMARSAEERQKVHLLTEFLTTHKGVSVVPDPYYGDGTAFDYALDLIEDACRGLYQLLSKIE
ncbi:MAG TPA: low molecular weight protein-tyrosine-phosphatase [Prevotella sp.]